MEIAIGIPNSVPGATGRLLLDWARLAEARGFSSLATIGRVAYPTYDSLITLAAAGAVTERIRLFTNILIAPTRDPALLAKQTASVAQLSDGRLVLGLAVGGRPDDYATLDEPFETRGQEFDATLDLLRRAWAGEPIAASPKPVGPSPPGDGHIPILIGGSSDAAIRRVAEVGDGWTASGGMPPDQIHDFAERVRSAWRDAGREREPRIAALTYYSLGEGTEQASIAYIEDYYAFLGDAASQFARSIPRSVEAVRETAESFREVGVDELVFDPTVADLSQVDLLADAVL